MVRFLTLVLATFGAAFLVIRTIMGWWSRVRVVARLDDAQNAEDAPELDPRREERVFLVEKPGPWEAVLDFVLYVKSWGRALARKRGVLVHDVARARSIAEEWEFIAMTKAADTRGLSYLPRRARDPLTLNLAKENLTRAGAPPEAHALIDRRLEKENGEFYMSLFSQAKLHAVDLTPDNTPERSYFKKYFQPLMVSFAEDQFRQSAGPQADLPRDALVEHLGYLASRRVRAVRLTSATPMIDVDVLRGALPRPIPASGYKRKDKFEARAWNDDKATQAILLVVDPEQVENARVIESAVLKRLRDCTGIDHTEWTPDLDDPPQPACFLWHCS